MKIKDFYTFSSNLSSATVQAHPIYLSKKENVNGLYDQHKLIMGEYRSITFPVVFKQEYGKKLEDVLDTGWPGLFLISDHLKFVLEKNNTTGWKCFEIKLLDKKEKEIKGYQGLSVTGRCGAIDHSQSEIIEKRMVPTGPLTRYYKGLYIGLDKWDGRDFFLPEEYFGIVVTSKVTNVLKINKVTNVKLKELSDIQIPEFAFKK